MRFLLDLKEELSVGGVHVHEALRVWVCRVLSIVSERAYEEEEEEEEKKASVAVLSANVACTPS